MPSASFPAALVLHPLTPENHRTINMQLAHAGAEEALIEELEVACRIQYEKGYMAGRPCKRQTTFGFYSLLGAELAGLSWLRISNWPARVGCIGGTTLPHQCGRGVASGSLAFLLRWAFERVGLNRVECGCVVSQRAHRRVLEALPGLQFEGVAREAALDHRGDFANSYCYAALRRDWLAHHADDERALGSACAGNAE